MLKKKLKIKTKDWCTIKNGFEKIRYGINGKSAAGFDSAALFLKEGNYVINAMIRLQNHRL